MTTIREQPSEEPLTSPLAPVKRGPGSVIANWLSSTDHKVIGYLYLITSFVFFVIAGVMALVIRAELAQPGIQLVSQEQYNQLFTMHGTLMLLLFATPLFAATLDDDFHAQPPSNPDGGTSGTRSADLVFVPTSAC